MRRRAFAVALLGAAACASLEGLTDGARDAGVDAGLESAVATEAGAETGAADTGTLPCTTQACVPVVLASAQESPVELALDDTSVYWRNAAAGSVHRIARDGGTLPTTVTTSANTPGLVVDGTSLYTIHFCNVIATALDGGAKSSSASACALTQLALGGTTLYTTGNGGKVFKLPVPVGDAGIVGVGTRPGGAVHQIAVAGGQVFYTFTADNGAGEVAYFPSAGGLSTTLVPGQDDPRGLAADETGVAWVTGGSPDAGTPGAVFAQRLLADTPHVVSNSAPATGAVALDVTYVYFASTGAPPNFVDATLFRARRDGSGAAEPLVTNEPRISAIAVDATSIYWASRSRFEDGGAVASSGTIKRLTKP